MSIIQYSIMSKMALVCIYVGVTRRNCGAVWRIYDYTQV